jgi:hypothetical protein
MMRPWTIVWARVLASCLFFLGLPAAEVAQAAGESNFQVQLIWGTNGEKPKDKPLKDVDPKLQERLKGVFKWKNYYEVSRKPLSVPKEASKKLTLSEKCEIQVQDVGSSRIEVRLFGEGHLVVKKVQTVNPGEVIVLAGDGKDDTAWFVVLNPTK